MAKTIFFRQCEMKKDGRQNQVAWIPESKAVIKKILNLDSRETGLTSKGWVVASVGQKMLYADVISRSSEHRRYRKEIDT